VVEAPAVIVIGAVAALQLNAPHAAGAISSSA
jgi:hypothetical protein